MIEAPHTAGDLCRSPWDLIEALHAALGSNGSLLDLYFSAALKQFICGRVIYVEELHMAVGFALKPMRC